MAQAKKKATGAESKPTAHNRKPSKGFKRLKALGEERVAVIENLLLKDYSSGYVASRIQNDWDALQDVKHSTLSRQIERYRRTEMAGQLAVYSDQLEKQDPSGERQKVALSRVAQDVDSIEELTELIHAQKARLQKIINREADMPTNMDQVGKDIKLLKDLIKDLAELQMETGQLQRAAKAFKGDLNLHASSERAVQTLNHDRQTQDQVAAATREALDYLGLRDEDVPTAPEPADHLDDD